MSPFPLLRLPSVATRHVIRTFPLRDLHYLSLTSNKTQKAISNSLPKNAIKIHVTRWSQTWESNNSKLHFHYGDIAVRNTEVVERRRWTLEDLRNPKKKTPPVIHFPLAKLASLLTTFKNSLNDPGFYFEIRGDETRELQVLQTAKLLNVRISNVKVDTSRPIPATIYANFLMECHEASELRLLSSPGNGFQYRPISKTYFQLDYLEVKHANWLEPEYFLMCKKIVLYAQLKPTGFLRFVREWMATECQLERLSALCPNKTMFEELVHSLRGTRVSQTQDGLEIESDYAKRAIIYHSEAEGKIIFEVKK